MGFRFVQISLTLKPRTTVTHNLTLWLFSGDGCVKLNKDFCHYITLIVAISGKKIASPGL